MIKWTYNNKEINSVDDFPPSTYGFVYIITNKKTGHYYIGKKILVFNQKKKLGKKEIAALPVSRGRKVTTKHIQKESDWQTYWGSSKQLLEQLKYDKENNYNKVILQTTTDKKELTYLEVKYQFKYNVLEDPLSYNDNISGRYFNTQSKLDKLK